MPKPLIFGHTLTHQNLSGNTAHLSIEEWELYYHDVLAEHW